MATRSWERERIQSANQLSFQNDALSITLLINRIHRLMRVIDFRSGATTAKQLYITSLAEREGVHKIFTLTEVSEAATWLRFGFQREGIVPAYFRRSDAIWLGLNLERADWDEAPYESGTRRVAPPNRVYDEGIERVLCDARLRARKLESTGLISRFVELSAGECLDRSGVRVRPSRPEPLHAPFATNGLRSCYSVLGRGGVDVHLSAETQPCFANAMVEVLSMPNSDAGAALASSGMASLVRKLAGEEIVGLFALTPAHDSLLASVFLANGFRATGLLHSHLIVGDRRCDALLWSRRTDGPTSFAAK